MATFFYIVLFFTAAWLFKIPDPYTAPFAIVCAMLFSYLHSIAKVLDKIKNQLDDLDLKIPDYPEE